MRRLVVVDEIGDSLERDEREPVLATGEGERRELHLLGERAVSREEGEFVVGRVEARARRHESHARVERGGHAREHRLVG